MWTWKHNSFHSRNKPVDLYLHACNNMLQRNGACSPSFAAEGRDHVGTGVRSPALEQRTGKITRFELVPPNSRDLEASIEKGLVWCQKPRRQTRQDRLVSRTSSWTFIQSINGNHFASNFLRFTTTNGTIELDYTHQWHSIVEGHTVGKKFIFKFNDAKGLFFSILSHILPMSIKIRSLILSLQRGPGTIPEVLTSTCAHRSFLAHFRNS